MSGKGSGKQGNAQGGTNEWQTVSHAKPPRRTTSSSSSQFAPVQGPGSTRSTSSSVTGSRGSGIPKRTTPAPSSAPVTLPAAAVKQVRNDQLAPPQASPKGPARMMSTSASVSIPSVIDNSPTPRTSTGSTTLPTGSSQITSTSTARSTNASSSSSALPQSTFVNSSGIDPEVAKRGYPLGFTSLKEFRDVTRPVAEANRSGTVIVSGSSVTGYSAKKGTPFDGNPQKGKSDIDVGVIRKVDDLEWEAISNKRGFPIGEMATLEKQYQRKARREVGRRTGIKFFDDEQIEHDGRSYMVRPHTPPPQRPGGSSTGSSGSSGNNNNNTTPTSSPSASVLPVTSRPASGSTNVWNIKGNNNNNSTGSTSNGSGPRSGEKS